MDSLTQIVLGAAVGEAILGKKVGNKAALWGAVCGTIPDLDVIATQFMPIVDSNIFHRSISHSILFFLLMSPITGWLLKCFYSKEDATVLQWSNMSFWAYFTHALLDCFTTWGTQLFWPWELKIAFKSIFVVDPLYTLPLMILLIMAMRLDKSNAKRWRLNYWGLGISSAYLLLTLVNKQMVGTAFENALNNQSIDYSRIETKPAPLNNLLWCATAETNDSFLIGYYSFMDSNDNIAFEKFPKNHALIDDYQHEEVVQKLIGLSDEWYTISKKNNTLYFNDLRFGTTTAWESGGDFIFAYRLILDEEGKMTAEEADKKLNDKPMVVLKKLWQRMMGN